MPDEQGLTIEVALVNCDEVRVLENRLPTDELGQAGDVLTKLAQLPDEALQEHIDTVGVISFTGDAAELVYNGVKQAAIELPYGSNDPDDIEAGCTLEVVIKRTAYDIARQNERAEIAKFLQD